MANSHPLLTLGFPVNEVFILHKKSEGSPVPPPDVGPHEAPSHPDVPAQLRMHSAMLSVGSDVRSSAESPR